MKTFKGKCWRFAWLNQPSCGIFRTTVYDISGKWKSIFFRLCWLVEPNKDIRRDQQGGVE